MISEDLDLPTDLSQGGRHIEFYTDENEAMKNLQWLALYKDRITFKTQIVLWSFCLMNLKNVSQAEQLPCCTSNPHSLGIILTKVYG